MKKYNILDISLITVIFLHMIYALFMFTQSALYGGIWTFITVIEGLIFLVGYKKIKFLKFFLAFVIILQFLASLAIMFLGTDIRNTNYQKVLVLGYELKDNQMSETLKMRLDKALEYSVNKDSTFILCGGITRENTVSEAAVMKDYLMAHGLDESRVILEDKSKDTLENIANALEYIGNDKEVLVISSNYHVFRAKMIAGKVGLKAAGLGSKAPLLLIPNQLLFEKLGIIGLMISQ